jgi:hypothetical protein
MAAQQDLNCERGATFEWAFTWYVSKNSPKDLTGYVANMDVRDVNNNLIIHLTTGIGPIGLTATLAAGGYLTAGQTYYYRITATTVNETQPSAEVNATPTGGNLSVTLSWTALAGAISYQVYRGTTTAGESVLVATIPSGAATTWTDNGATATAATPPTTSTAVLSEPVLNAPSVVAGGALTAGTKYYYKLTVLGGTGESDAPTEVSATPASTNLSVSHAWTTITGAAGYNLYRGTAPGAENVLVATINDGTAAAFTDDGATLTTALVPVTNTATIPPPIQTTPTAVTGGSLVSGTPYYYVITALTAAGETIASHEKTLTPSSGNLKIKLNWLAVTGATGYNIYRTLTPGIYGTPSFLATIGSGATVTYTDDGTVALTTGAPPGNTAVIPAPALSNATLTFGGSLATVATYYVITALTAAGETVVSNEKSATPSGGNLSIILAWSAGNGGATSYNIYRSTVSGTYGLSSFLANVPTGLTYTDTGGVPLSAGTPPVENTAAILPPVQSAAVLSSGGLLTSGQQYGYVITATVTGETTISNEELITVSGSNLSAKLSWAAVDGAKGYNIYRTTVSGVYGRPSLLASVSQTTLSYIDDGTITITTGIPPGNTATLPTPTQSATSTATTGGALAANTYYYIVIAITANGEAPSNEESQATTGNKSKVTINWSLDTGATGYKIYRGTAAAGENVLIGQVGSAVTSFVDYGALNQFAAPPVVNNASVLPPVQGSPSTATTGGALVAGTYYYTITALTAAGESLPSNEKSQVTTGSTSVNTINWSLSTGATEYKVYRGTVPGGESVLIGTPGAAATSFVDYGAIAGSYVPPGLITLGGNRGTVVAIIAASSTILLPSGTFSYDIFFDSPDGIKTRLFTGDYNIIPNITVMP